MGTSPLYDDNPAPAVGLLASNVAVANTATASAYAMRQVIAYMNAIMGKRLKVHFSHFTNQSLVDDPAETFFFRFHTSPNGGRVRIRMVLSVDRSNQVDPKLNWSIRLMDPNAATRTFTQPAYHNTRHDPNIGPQNFAFIEQEWSGLVGDATYVAKLWQYKLCQVISCTVFEMPPHYLDVTQHVFADASNIVQNMPIYDRDITQVWTAFRAAYKSMGPVLFAWSEKDTSHAKTTTSSTFHNAIDGSSTAYSSTTPGFFCTHLGADVGTYWGTVDSASFGVTFWAIISCSSTAFTGGAIEFVDSNGVVATITLQSGCFPTGGSGNGFAYPVAVQATWNAAASAGKLDVLFKSDATRTLRLHAAGAYAREPFDPRSLANLTAWYAADRIAGLSDGTAVASWADSSGNGNTLTQGTGADQPLYKVGIISGKPVVRFDGSNDFLAAADSSTYKTAALSVFVVFADTGSTTTGLVVGYPNASTFAANAFRWGLSSLPGTPDIVAYANDAASTYAAGVSTFKVWGLRTATGEVLADGADVHAAGGAVTVTYPNATGLLVGCAQGTNIPFKGDIAEIIMYGRQLTTAEVGQVELYLMEKYGIRDLTAL